MDLYWVWLATINGIGPVNSKKLLAKFETPHRIYDAKVEELCGLCMINKSYADKIVNSRSLAKAEKIIEYCHKNDIKLLRFSEKLYPEEVKMLNKSPILLYYRGTLIKNSMGVGIVGSRRCSEYGRRVAAEAAEYLAENRIPVISGMAKGIEGYAQTICLKKKGYTLALLGNSVDICYPQEHNKLMDKIVENGAVLSQFPPMTKPADFNFHKRNYLLSAWSEKLLVIEAGEKSGALMTASHAKEQHREVWAAPNSIYSKESIGTNRLIEDGCRIYLNPQQLINEGARDNGVRSDSIAAEEGEENYANDIEKTILEIIGNSPKTVEEIFSQMEENKGKVINTISAMGIDGKIKTLAGGKIARN